MKKDQTLEEMQAIRNEKQKVRADLILLKIHFGKLCESELGCIFEL